MHIYARINWARRYVFLHCSNMGDGRKQCVLTVSYSYCLTSQVGTSESQITGDCVLLLLPDVPVRDL